MENIRKNKEKKEKLKKIEIELRNILKNVEKLKEEIKPIFISLEEVSKSLQNWKQKNEKNEVDVARIFGTTIARTELLVAAAAISAKTIEIEINSIKHDLLDAKEHFKFRRMHQDEMAGKKHWRPGMKMTQEVKKMHELMYGESMLFCNTCEKWIDRRYIKKSKTTNTLICFFCKEKN